jgi:hypothetical protein
LSSLGELHSIIIVAILDKERLRQLKLRRVEEKDRIIRLMKETKK